MEKSCCRQGEGCASGKPWPPCPDCPPPHPYTTSSSLYTCSLDSTAAPQGLTGGTEIPLPGSLSPLEPHLLPLLTCTKLLLTSGLLPVVCDGSLTQASASLRKPPAVRRQGPWARCHLHVAPSAPPFQMAGLLSEMFGVSHKNRALHSRTLLLTATSCWREGTPSGTRAPRPRPHRQAEPLLART